MIDKEASIPKGSSAGHANGNSHGDMELDDEL
jgi:hypothetical protein